MKYLRISSKEIPPRRPEWQMKKACLSVILSDQVRDDVKDMIYQITGIAHAVIPAPDQVGGDVKDMIIKLRESPFL